MAKLVVSEFVTLDGVMEDPGGAEKRANGGWAFRFERGPEGDRFKLEELQAADVLLLGRRTYEGFAAAWPSVRDEEGFADKMNGMRKVVVSATLGEPTWNNTTVVRDDLVGAVTALRGADGGDVLVAGSASLVHALLEHDLVDELRLMVFPAVLGEGKRLFPDGVTPRAFETVEVGRAGDVATLVLRRTRA